MSPGEPVPDAPVGPRRRFPGLPEWAGVATRLLHADRRPDANAGAVVAPIYRSSTFHFPARHSESAATGGTYHYTRHENPTLEAAGEIVRDLEGGAAARVFGSGMGAISTTLLALLAPGDELVALESPTNPTLRVIDLARWAEACDAVGAITVADNTFATPVLQRPLDLGIDLAVHSGTKYLGGHADLLAGVVVGPIPLLERIRSAHLVLGSVLDPEAAYLLARGLRTLELRVRRSTATAGELVSWLAAHPRIERVAYPGRGSALEEAIAARQMRGRGGMIAFTVRGGLPAAQRFLGRLRIVQPASSLGGVESLASLPRETSHATLTDAERARRGIDDGLVRLSVGLEDVEDLRRDLEEALRVDDAPASGGHIGGSR